MSINSKVSVIVPIYNGYQFLPRLLDCLIKQTYNNIEFILIDDYSTDDSFNYLCEKTKDDIRFKVLQPEKKGGTASINIEYALKIISGDYYFYMSQDDFIDYDCIEKCVLKAESEDADIVIPNCILFYSDEKKINQSEYPLNGNYNQTLNNTEAFNLSINWKIHGFILKKISLFKKTGFEGKYLNSDEMYVRYHYLLANKICFCDTNFYYYQANENAITKHFSYRHIDFLTTLIMVFRFASENKISQECLSNIYSEILKLYDYYANKLKSESFLHAEKEYYESALLQAKNDIKKIAPEVKNGKSIFFAVQLKLHLHLIKQSLKKWMKRNGK